MNSHIASRGKSSILGKASLQVFRNPKEKFYLFKLPVPRLDDVDDAGVGVENDEGGEVEGAHGRVDDVARVLVVLALRLVGAVPVRV